MNHNGKIYKRKLREFKDEVNISNEKYINPKKYIGDENYYNYYYNHNNNNKNNNITSNSLDNFKMRLSVLEMKVERIYKALSSTNIIKATPLKTLIFHDVDKCQESVSNIYNSWIRYLSNMGSGNSYGGITFNNIFANIDKYIFNYFFLNYQRINNLEIVIKHFSKNDKFGDIEKRILSFNRYVDSLELKIPENKEFVSVATDGKKIYIYYFPQELSTICMNDYGATTTTTSTRVDPDLQLTQNLHQSMSLNENVVNQIDNKGLSVGISNDGNKLINMDRRFVVLSAERPLFNTTVDVSTLNTLNDTLYGIGPAILNYTLIIFHAMLHLKCFLDTKSNYCLDHGEGFIHQLINYTPSTLFGHSLFPPMTLPR